MDSKKILVIDDDESIRLLFEIALKTAGFEVATAEDGQIGIEKVISFKPDLIILDLMMPRLNGFQVARQLQQSPETATIQILVATGYGDEAEQHSIAKEPNVAAVLIKPIRPKELVEKIRGLLEV